MRLVIEEIKISLKLITGMLLPQVSFPHRLKFVHPNLTRPSEICSFIKGQNQSNFTFSVFSSQNPRPNPRPRLFFLPHPRPLAAGTATTFRQTLVQCGAL